MQNQNIAKATVMSTTIQSTAISPFLFRPFGDLISLENARALNCNQGRAIRFDDIVNNIDVSDHNGRIGVSVYRCIASSLPFPLDTMERHPLGTQAFIPGCLDASHHYLVAVAPAGNLDIMQIKAFIVPAKFGIQYKKGVWHHPIVALDKPIDFFTIDRIGGGSNCEEITFQPGNMIV